MCCHCQWVFELANELPTLAQLERVPPEERTPEQEKRIERLKRRAHIKEKNASVLYGRGQRLIDMPWMAMVRRCLLTMNLR